MINLKALQYAILLKRTGSFSEAARQAEVSQSAISQQISKLESELGIALFDRKSKPLDITTAGKGFLERAESLVLEAEQLWDYGLEVSDKKVGRVNLGIIPTLSPYLSPLFLNDLGRTYPQLKIDIYELKTSDIIRGLTNRTLQAGIIATPVRTSLNLNTSILFYEPFHIYTSAKSRLAARKNISLDELKETEIWLLNEGNCLSDQISRMCSVQKKSSESAIHSYHTDSLDALRNFITHTDGLTIMPELATLCVPAQDEDLIKKIKGVKLGREISMIHLKGAAASQLIRTIADQVKDNLPRNLLKQGQMEIIDPGIRV